MTQPEIMAILRFEPESGEHGAGLEAVDPQPPGSSAAAASEQPARCPADPGNILGSARAPG